MLYKKLLSGMAYLLKYKDAQGCEKNNDRLIRRYSGIIFSRLSMNITYF